MSMQQMDDSRDEYITIIATAGEAMAQFRAQGLDRKGYAIVGRMGRHQFSLVTGSSATEVLGGAGGMAATFVRRVPA
jgi:hypothetical protein